MYIVLIFFNLKPVLERQSLLSHKHKVNPYRVHSSASAANAE